MVSIDATLTEMKIVADYESVIINKSNFYEFDFTKFDDLSWVQDFPDLKEKVLFQIKLTDETAGTIVLELEQACFVGDWLWNVAIGACESEEFRKLSAGMFGDEGEDKKIAGSFDFPTHFHRFVESKFKMTETEEAEWQEMKRQETELGESYRRTLEGWNVLIPIDKEVAFDMLKRYEKTALPIEDVNSITLKIGAGI